MTEELKQAAQQALEALTALLPNKNDPNHDGHDARDIRKWRALVERLRALTQRPAAQDDDGVLLPRRLAATQKLKQLGCHYDAAQGQWLPTQPAAQADSMGMPTSCGKPLCSPDEHHPLCKLHQPAAQATPEPLPLGPLAKRNIYDAIRGAYDLGYNDARNARTVPGDSAPGYDGRSVEEDHGSALFNILSKRLKPATPEPVGEPDTVPLDALHAAERERDYWKTRARAMLDHAEGTCWYWMGDGEDHLESLVNNLPVVIRADQLRKMLTRPAPGVPDVEAAAKKLAECMGYPWEHMPSAGRVNMRKHAEAVLAAAQAKGGGHG